MSQRVIPMLFLNGNSKVFGRNPVLDSFTMPSQSIPSTPTVPKVRTRTHGLVKTNYLLRSASFGVTFVSLAFKLWGKVGPVMWALLVLFDAALALEHGIDAVAG